MNSKEVKRFHQQLAEQYGFPERLQYVFLLHEKKDKVSIITQEYRDLDLGKAKIDALGLYIAAWFNGKLRLTIEGTQLIGPQVTKNVLALTREQMQRWMLGQDLEVAEVEGAADITPGEFVIVRYNDDFLGSAKIAKDQLLNYIPKTRYVHALYE